MTNPIVSIQRGTVTIAAGATSQAFSFTSVNTSNATCKWGSFNSQNTDDAYGEILGGCGITSATGGVATRGKSNASNSVTLWYEIVEKDSSVMQSAVQRGTISLGSGVLSNTATLGTTVDTNLAVCHFGGCTSNVSGASFIARDWGGVSLTSGSQVTFSRGVNPTQTVVGYYEVEELTAVVINSIQQFTVTLTSAGASDTQAITSVDTTQAELLYQGILANTTGINNATDITYYFRITGASQLTFSRGGTNTGSRSLKCTVREYKSGTLTSIQRGTFTMTSVTSLSTSLSSVNTSQAYTNFCGFNFAGALSMRGNFWMSMQLLDATHISSAMNTSSATNNTGSYEIPEWAAGAVANTVIETITPSDSFGASLTANASFSETATVTDSYAGRKITFDSISESITPSENYAALAIDKPSLSETETVTDSYAASLSALPVISESITVSDTYDATSFPSTNTVAETITESDSYNAQLAANDNETESITVSDSYDCQQITASSGATPQTGPSDGAWDKYLQWLRRKKKKQWRRRAKNQHIPESIAERAIEAAALEVIHQEIRLKPPYEVLARQNEDVARHAAQKAILDIYEAAWAQTVREATGLVAKAIELEKQQQQEDEELFLMMM